MEEGQSVGRVEIACEENCDLLDMHIVYIETIDVLDS